MQVLLVNNFVGRRRACAVLCHVSRVAPEKAASLFDRLLGVVGAGKVVDAREDGSIWLDGVEVQLVEAAPVPVEPPPVPVELPPEPEPEPVVKRKPERKEAPAPVSKKKKGKKR
jgi:hypothetical protein